MIKEVGKFIELKTSFVIGKNLYIGHRLPTSKLRCQVVLESGGGKPYFDLPERIDKPIQIISRAETYFDARNDAWEIFDALITNHPYGSAGWTLPIVVVGKEYEALTIDAIADPQYIGQDEKGRFEFSTNYIFKIRKK